MKFWKENKVANEFDLPIGEVSNRYIEAVTERCLPHHAKGPEHDVCSRAHDWRLKAIAWPLERALRDWLTSPDGLNSVWEDERDFAALVDWVAEALVLAGVHSR